MRNDCRGYFHELQSFHKICENSLPQKFPCIQYVDQVILLVYTAPPCLFRMVSHWCHHLSPWQLALLNFPQHSLFHLIMNHHTSHLIDSSLISSSFPSHQEVTHDASQLSPRDTYIYLSIPLSWYVVHQLLSLTF